MEPLLYNKRNVVAYVPYRMRSETTPEYFLQKRDMHAPTHPGIFSLFGGGIEDSESLPEALMREVLEELSIEPTKPVYFTKSERSIAILHTFIEEVDEEFESRVHVQEGEYGTFMTLEEARGAETSAISFAIITDIKEWLVSGAQ